MFRSKRWYKKELEDLSVKNSCLESQIKEYETKEQEKSKSIEEKFLKKHQFVIVVDGIVTKVYQDGNEIKRIRKISCDYGPVELPCFTTVELPCFTIETN